MNIVLQVNSIFHLKRPYDLMALIDQERRVDLLETLKAEMLQKHSLADQKYYEKDENTVGGSHR